MKNISNEVTSEKETLKELLKKYEGILTVSMIDYLKSLIELEFSVVREYIKDEDREILADLEIYKKVAIFNIYNRALDLFQRTELGYSYKDKYNKLTISLPISGDQKVDVFSFGYTELEKYKTRDIGEITLFLTLEDQKLREKEMNYILNQLERLYTEKNPYVTDGRVGSSLWDYKHIQDIEEYEKRFTELDNKKELSEMEKREIEVTKQGFHLLLEDYGLTTKSFVREEPILKQDESHLKRTLIKKQPNLIIVNKIEYI